MHGSLASAGLERDGSVSVEHHPLRFVGTVGVRVGRSADEGRGLTFGGRDGHEVDVVVADAEREVVVKLVANTEGAVDAGGVDQAGVDVLFRNSGGSDHPTTEEFGTAPKFPVGTEAETDGVLHSSKYVDDDDLISSGVFRGRAIVVDVAIGPSHDDTLGLEGRPPDELEVSADVQAGQDTVGDTCADDIWVVLEDVDIFRGRFATREGRVQRATHSGGPKTWLTCIGEAHTETRHLFASKVRDPQVLVLPVEAKGHAHVEPTGIDQRPTFDGGVVITDEIAGAKALGSIVDGTYARSKGKSNGLERVGSRNGVVEREETSVDRMPPLGAIDAARNCGEVARLAPLRRATEGDIDGVADAKTLGSKVTG